MVATALIETTHIPVCVLSFTLAGYAKTVSNRKHRPGSDVFDFIRFSNRHEQTNITNPIILHTNIVLKSTKILLSKGSFIWSKDLYSSETTVKLNSTLFYGPVNIFPNCWHCFRHDSCISWTPEQIPKFIQHIYHNEIGLIITVKWMQWRLTIVYSTVYLGADRRKHQSSASLTFVRGIHRWPVNSPHKGPVTRENVSIWWRHHASLRFSLPGIERCQCLNGGFCPDPQQPTRCECRQGFYGTLCESSKYHKSWHFFYPSASPFPS